MDVRKVGIVGAGTMGCGIAECVAERGYEVILVDRTEDLIEEARNRIEASLNKKLEKWAITEAEKRVTLARIRPSSQLAAIAPADLVIEAVVEDPDVKKEVFRALDNTCPEGVVFATNTSTLSVTELAEVTRRPDRVIGLHFLNPVNKIKLVEIVRGLKTSDETFATASKFVTSLRKTGVEVHESPGFVTTRVLAPLLNEAMYTLMEGVASAKGIDTAMKLGFDLGKGPLELADRMGLDTVLAFMDRLFRDLGDPKFRPCPLLRKLVRAGHLGVKTGQGFFKYDADGNLVD
ncbi:MAG: 3-hydroxyacyl-CoA dehydrogenase NAD-binding domain-containing protein [Firmicutes bacterium]|nr:3-hydroxyacyl-CoA dehydrogenase NAD-binding domain-containing protein [Bacillota bacterium]MDH7495206.1 3-hydroxyacyl-CoA dehydrogenase NAD-binding domain-containing protein [Bacillota bacterium]